MNANILKAESPFSLSENKAKRFPSLKLFEAGKITPGQAARSAGFSKQALIDGLGNHEIFVINYSSVPTLHLGTA